MCGSRLNQCTAGQLNRCLATHFSTESNEDTISRQWTRRAPAKAIREKHYNEWNRTFMGVLWGTEQDSLPTPKTTAAEATWQRESSHSATVRCCLARGELAAGKQKWSISKFPWDSITHPGPGWCDVFSLYGVWVYIPIGCSNLDPFSGW